MIEPGGRHRDKFSPNQLAVRQVRQEQLLGGRDLVDG
jgi:hypothetical protein